MSISTQSFMSLIHFSFDFNFTTYVTRFESFYDPRRRKFIKILLRWFLHWWPHHHFIFASDIIIWSAENGFDATLRRHFFNFDLAGKKPAKWTILGIFFARNLNGNDTTLPKIYEFLMKNYSIEKRWVKNRCDEKEWIGFLEYWQYTTRGWIMMTNGLSNNFTLDFNPAGRRDLR